MGSKIINVACGIIVALVMLWLTFHSYYLLSADFPDAETRPGWFSATFLASWFPFIALDEDATKSKTAWFIVPVLFFVYMLTLSGIRYIIYIDDLGKQNCIETIYEVAKWNGIVLVTIPLLYINHLLSSRQK